MADEKKPPIPPKLPHFSMNQKKAPGTAKPILPKPPMPGAPRPPVQNMPTPPKGISMPIIQAHAEPSKENANYSKEIEELKKGLESQVLDLQKQLQGEKEKSLLQSMKAKEEEAVASKVEESLKDIQDRLRRDKREQELQEQLVKMENLAKEMETKLSQERQTWVETLKTQLTQRDGHEKEYEHMYEIKIKELEKRWHEDKLNWMSALKSREEENARGKKEFETALDKEHELFEQKTAHVNIENESMKKEIRDLQEIRQEEKENILAKLENRDKEYLGIKAQQAMLVAQLRTEKDKTEQMRSLLEKMKAEKNNYIALSEKNEREYFLLKTQTALYQARAKSEQEKVLKELFFFKEQNDKNSKQYEINLRSKDEEISLIKKTYEERAIDLKNTLAVKETELSNMAKDLHDKLKIKEQEVNLIWEKRDAQLNRMNEELSRKLQQAEEKLGKMYDAERSISAENAKRGQRIFEVEECVRRKEDEAKMLNSRILELESAIRDAKLSAQDNINDLQVSRKTIDDLKTQLFEKERIIDRNLTEKTAKENEVKALSSKMHELENANTQFVSKNHDLENLFKESVSEKEKSIIEKTAKENEAKELSGRVNELLNENTRFESKIHELESAAKELTRENDKNVIEKSAKENEIKELSAKVSELKNVNARFESKIQDLEGAVKEFVKEKSILISDKTAKDNESRNLSIKVSELESKKAGFESKVHELEHALRQSAADIQRWEEKTGYLQKEKDDALRNLAAKDNEIVSLRLNEHDLMKSIEDSRKTAEAEKHALVEQVMAKDKDIEHTKNEAILKEKDILIESSRRETSMRHDNARLEEKLSYMEKALKDKENELQKKERELSTQILELNHILQSVRNENTSIKRDFDRLAAERAGEDDKYKQMAKDVERRYKAEKDALNDIISLKEHEILKVKIDAEGIRSKSVSDVEERMRGEISRLSAEKSEMAQAFSQEINTIKDQMESELKDIEINFGREKQELGRMVQEHEKSAAELNAKLKASQNALANESANRKMTEDAIAAEKTRFNEEKAKLEEKISIYDNELKNERNELDKMKANYETLENALIEKTKEDFSMKDEIAEFVKTQDDEVSKPAQVNDLKKNTQTETSEQIPDIGIIENSSNAMLNHKAKSKMVFLGKLCDFWENLNKPVLEIDLRKKD